MAAPQPERSVRPGLLRARTCLVLTALFLPAVLFPGNVRYASAAYSVLACAAAAVHLALLLLRPSDSSEDRNAGWLMAAWLPFAVWSCRPFLLPSHSTELYYLQGVLDAGVTLSAHALFLWAVFGVIRERSESRFLLNGLALGALAGCLAGWIQRFSSQTLPDAFGGVGARGFFPFANENHLGGWAALLLPLFLNEASERLRNWRDDRRERAGFAVPDASGLRPAVESGAMVFWLASATLTASVLVTQARFPVLVIAGYLAFAFVRSFFSRKNLPGVAVLVLVLAAAGGIVAVTAHFWVRAYAPGDLWHALSTRWDAWSDVARMIAARPGTGWGLGSFGSVSPNFISTEVDRVYWRQAHNDPLQLVAETGFAGAALFLLPLVVLAALSRRLSAHSPSRRRRNFSGQAFEALFLFAIMECTDFHARIPAVGALAAMQVAGLLLGIHRAGDASGSAAKPRPSRPGLWPAAAGLVLALTTLQTAANARAFLSDPAAASRVRRGDADLWRQRAEIHYRLGSASTGAARARSYRAAIACMRRAVRLNPLGRSGRLGLGQLLYKAGYRRQGIQAVESAARLAPPGSAYPYIAAEFRIREARRTQGREALLHLGWAKVWLKRGVDSGVPPDLTALRKRVGRRGLERLQELAQQSGYRLGFAAQKN